MGGAEWICDHGCVTEQRRQSMETRETRETRRAARGCMHGDNEGDKELQECWNGIDQLQELYFSILFSGGQGHDS